MIECHANKFTEQTAEKTLLTDLAMIQATLYSLQSVHSSNNSIILNRSSSYERLKVKVVLKRLFLRTDILGVFESTCINFID